MKKILLLLTPVFILIVVFGCSKEHEAVTFTKYNITANEPTNVNATFDIDKDVVKVTWDMNYSTNILDSVVGYEITVSDSLNFYKGDLHNKIATGSTEKSYEIPAGNYITEEDTLKVLFFNVSAIFKIGEHEFFTGAYSGNPTSAAITRD